MISLPLMTMAMLLLLSIPHSFNVLMLTMYTVLLGLMEGILHIIFWRRLSGIPLSCCRIKQ